jgi:chromosomal replication initiator protein
LTEKKLRRSRSSIFYFRLPSAAFFHLIGYSTQQYFSKSGSKDFHLVNIWSKVLKEFKDEIPSHFFEPFIKPLRPLQDEPVDGVYVLGVPDERIFCYLEKRYLSQIETKLKSLMGKDVTIQLKSIKESQFNTPVGLNPWINPAYSFRNFIKLESNRLAISVLEKSVTDPTDAGLIFINGESGSGKTHLLHAFASAVTNRHPKLSITYLNLDFFKVEFDQLSGAERKSALKKRYSEGDLLLVDDMNLIGGYGKSVEELIHYIINGYLDRNATVITTSDRSLTELNLSRRFINRLISGIQLQILTSATEGRALFLYEILKKSGLTIPAGLVDYLTPRLKPNFHIIKSMANTILFLLRNEYDLSEPEFIEKNLAGFLEKNANAVVSMDNIVNAVSLSFGIPADHIHGNSRRSEITLPRHIAMYLGIKLTRLNKSAVARYFSKKDHTTVINAEKKITRLLKNDPALQNRIEIIQQNLWKNRE